MQKKSILMLLIFVTFFFGSANTAEFPHLAIKNNDVSTIRRFLKNGLNVNAKDEYGNPLLIWAARYNVCDITKLLLKKGADINMGNDYKLNALMVTARYNSYEVAKFLIDKNADINKRDIYGYTALMYAMEYNAIAVIELLYENKGVIFSKNF